MVDGLSIAKAIDTARVITNYDNRSLPFVSKGELYTQSATPNIQYKRLNAIFAPVEQASQGASSQVALYKHVVPIVVSTDQNGNEVRMPLFTLDMINSANIYVPIYANGITTNSNDEEVEYFLIEEENIKSVCFNPVDLLEAANEYMGLPCANSVSVGFQSESYNPSQVPLRIQKIFDYYTRTRVMP